MCKKKEGRIERKERVTLFTCLTEIVLLHNLKARFIRLEMLCCSDAPVQEKIYTFPEDVTLKALCLQPLAKKLKIDFSQSGEFTVVDTLFNRGLL